MGGNFFRECEGGKSFFFFTFFFFGPIVTSQPPASRLRHRHTNQPQPGHEIKLFRGSAQKTLDLHPSIEPDLPSDFQSFASSIAISPMMQQTNETYE